MAAKSKTRYALLGMLSAKPKSGYDIKKDFEVGFSLFWGESFGQIYKVLKQLEQEKLVTRKHQIQKGRPSKDLYTITQKGREELKKYLAEPPEKMVVRDEMMLKFLFGFNAPVERNMELLQWEIKKLQTMLDQATCRVQEKLAEIQPGPTRIYIDRLISLALDYHKTRIKWCKESIKRLQLMH